MCGELKATLFLVGVFILLFANMTKDRNYESEDKNVD